MTRSWTEADVDDIRARLAALAATLPGAEVEDANGHTAYVVRGKRFAWLLVDHHGDERLALSVKAPPGAQEALVSSEPHRYFVPSYVGPRGWVGVDLHAADPDWDEIAALFEQAWRLTASRRAVAAHDADTGA